MPSQDAFDPLEQAVLCSGFATGERILIAVSGGPDSVALLSTLCRLASRPECAWRLRVAHVNHGLRGMESDLDERFVCGLASAFGLGIDVCTVDLSVAGNSSPEAAAREQRYAALRAALGGWPGDVLVTGHTLNDQTETFVLRLLRGAGLVGLGAMKPRSHDVVRPFLRIRREQILVALQEHRLGYRVDSTNADKRFERNRVRLDVMPVLDSVQPRAAAMIGRATALLQTDAEFVLAEAAAAREHLSPMVGDSAVNASLSVWRTLHPAIRRHVVRLLAWDVLGRDHPLQEQHVSLICGVLEQENDRVITSQLPFRLSIEIRGSRFTLRTGIRAPESPYEPACLEFSGCMQWHQGVLCAELLSPADAGELKRFRTVCGPSHALCDPKSVKGTLLVRSRRSGDRMRPLGMEGSRKLQDLMVDRQVPRDIRHLIPVVTHQDSIVWVPGVAFAAGAALRDDARTALHLSYRSAALIGI